MPRKKVAIVSKNKRRTRKTYRKKKNTYNRIQSVVMRMPGVIVADKTFAKLMYIDSSSNVLAGGGNTYGYLRYYSNGLDDANPLILSAVIPGYKPMMSLYENFRVLGCKIEVNASNQENFPVNFLIWPSDQDQSGVITYQYLQEMIGNAFTKYRTLSAKGGMDRSRLVGYISFKKLIGSKNYLTDVDYAGSLGANPAKLMFWHVGAYTLTGSVFTAASVPFESRLTFYCEFYNRRQLTG